MKAYIKTDDVFPFKKGDRYPVVYTPEELREISGEDDDYYLIDTTGASFGWTVYQRLFTDVSHLKVIETLDADKKYYYVLSDFVLEFFGSKCLEVE